MVRHAAGNTTAIDDAGPAAGAEGNARLTSITGLALLVMLAVEGYTILDVQGLITLHIFLGTMLVAPVLLKSGSTIYRFSRYYAGVEPYVRKGPPHPILRVIGPLVIISSLLVLGSGLGLLAVPAGKPDFCSRCTKQASSCGSP